MTSKFFQKKMCFLLLLRLLFTIAKIENFTKFIEKYVPAEDILKFKMSATGVKYPYEEAALNDNMVILKHKMSNEIRIPHTYQINLIFLEDYLTTTLENLENFSDFAFATKDHEINWESLEKNCGKNTAFAVSLSGFKNSIIFVPFEKDRPKRFTYRSGKTLLILPVFYCTSPLDVGLIKNRNNRKKCCIALRCLFEENEIHIPLIENERKIKSSHSSKKALANLKQFLTNSKLTGDHLSVKPQTVEEYLNSQN